MTRNVCISSRILLWWRTIFYFLLIILFFYISNDIPLPGYPSITPLFILHLPSSLSSLPLWGYSPSHPPTPTPPIQPPPMLGHQTGPRTSPSTDVRQGHPLLHVYVESWIRPCKLLGWWSSPWKYWVVWLMLFFLWGCNKPLPHSTSSSSSSPPGSPSWVWLLATRIHIWIGRLLAKPPKEQPHQVPISKCLLATAKVSRFGVCRQDGFLGGAISI